MADFRCNKPYPTSWNGVKPYRDLDKTRPYPPNNVFVTHPYIIGVLDVRWDNPLEVPENSQWEILGINLYRSEDSECGPYEKINTDPIETLYYRDQTINRLVADEDVMPRLSRGENPRADWFFRTLKRPIVKQDSQDILADNPSDIVVKIDNGDGQGPLIIPSFKVDGRAGEVYLITKPISNPETRRLEEPRLPIGPNAKCYCSYWYNTNLIRSDLYPRFFYKITTVGRDNLGNILETKLDQVWPVNVHQLEKPHYIWKSIIVKNRYLLEQMGERVKVFIRKEVGERCLNYSDTHQQAHSMCTICYGVGIVGGYYGPFDAIIAPPEAEKHIAISDVGLKLNFTFESWTGPSPVLRTRDFIVRQNGERMMVGSVTPQGAKGAIFQQHFTLNYRNTKDIIYQIPIYGNQSDACYVAENNKVPVSDDTRGVNQPVTDASPIIPDYKSKRARTDKGRTIDYENVVW